jgi:hypothetical protein
MTKTWGEKVTSPYSPVPVQNDNIGSAVIVDVDCVAEDFEPGVYFFAGAFLFHVWIGKTMNNHHVDIGFGTSIDPSPAGGSTYGCHIPVIGDAGPGGNIATLARPCGTRILQITREILDGEGQPIPQHVRLRGICNHNGQSNGVNAVYASGCLNWHRIADLPS